MRRELLLWVLASATLAGACGGDPLDDGEPRRGGGWDLNSGNWNGNMGSWGTVAGIGGNPAWAPNGTGTGTLTNSGITGLRWIAPQATTACGALTAGVDRVRFLSSTRTVTGATGPDVELDRGGNRARLTMGERVTFHADALDGTLAAIHVTVRVRRVDTLTQDAAPEHEWPVFELELCEHARPERGFVHLGYVSWAPMVVLPETAAGGFSFPAGVVQPVTTLPRLEYRNNPAVPPVVANQTGALMFKFAFYASLPVALDDSPDLAFTTSRGATLDNNQVLIRGAIALGNGAWVTLPGDPGQHQFLTFFTRTGTPAAMFAIARGDGSGPAEVKLPATWGRGTVGALQLTPPELSPSAGASLDSIHAYLTDPLPPGDVWAHGPDELGHGPSTQRHGYYLGGSGNNLRMVFFAQLQASTARTRWVGVIDGQVEAQRQLAQLMMLPPPGPAFVVAAEAPPPDGKPALDSPPLGPMPDDSPVFAPAVPIDAHEWEDDAAVDAGVDAPTDATALDAADTDAAVPIDGRLGLDATLDVDAPSLIHDGGVDAPSVDAPVLIHDGGVDAPLAPIDATSNPMCKAPGCDAPPA